VKRASAFYITSHFLKKILKNGILCLKLTLCTSNSSCFIFLLFFCQLAAKLSNWKYPLRRQIRWRPVQSRPTLRPALLSSRRGGSGDFAPLRLDSSAAPFLREANSICQRGPTHRCCICHVRDDVTITPPCFAPISFSLIPTFSKLSPVISNPFFD